MTAIQEIHDKVFEFLLEKHFEEKKEGRDFFFLTWLRTNRDRKDKYTTWSKEFNNYSGVTFWTGYDYESKAVNIYLEFKESHELVLILMGSKERERLLNELSDRISGLQKLKWGYWTKAYAGPGKADYLEYLNEFLEGDKKIIDHFVDEIKQRTEKYNVNQGNPSVQREISPPLIGKISSNEFYHMLNGFMVSKCKTPDYFFARTSTEELPGSFSLKSLEVRNYRGIKYLRLEGIPVDSKWIVLTGENGFGKSSILQSIAIGFFGNEENKDKLLAENSFVLLEGKIRETHFLNFSFNFHSDRPFTSIGNKLAVYGASRLNIYGNTFRQASGNVTYNLFYPDGSLTNIEKELTDAYAYNKTRFKIIKDAFCRLITDLADIKVEVIEGKPVVRYLEKDLEGNTYNEVTFEQMASGFRSIIAMIGDIITRLSTGQGELKSLGNLTGVVIIDELELHLHPKYQKLLPKTLSELFPKVLFIASTHSPIPLLGMPRETVLVKVNRSAEKGITAERLDVDFTSMLPNALLTSPVFGFQDIIPEAHDASTMLEVADAYSEVKREETREQKVGEFLTEERTQELLNLLKRK